VETAAAAAKSGNSDVRRGGPGETLAIDALRVGGLSSRRRP